MTMCKAVRAHQRYSIAYRQHLAIAPTISVLHMNIVASSASVQSILRDYLLSNPTHPSLHSVLSSPKILVKIVYMC